MKLCKNLSGTYCKHYKCYISRNECSVRCNRRAPTIWWKIKVFFMRKPKEK